jgi:hypothetical protein
MAVQYFLTGPHLVVDGNEIRIFSGFNWSRAWKNATAPMTTDLPEFDKPVSFKDSIAVPYSDITDHVDLDILMTIEEAKLPVTVTFYPEGNAAGKRSWTGSCLVSTTGIDVGEEKSAQGTVTFNAVGGLTRVPNLALATNVVTAGTVGDAHAGFTFVASGGTSTYAYDLPDFGTTDFVVQGLTFTDGVIAGTPDAGTKVGRYYFYMDVTDSAATPVVKRFLCYIDIGA